MPPDHEHPAPELRLIQMANQITVAFAHLRRRADGGEQQAVAAVEHHLRSFWDPRMRTKIIAHVQAARAASGDSGLDPVALQAVERLNAATNAG